MFSETTPDLTRTRFALSDLTIARSVWRDIFTRHAPNWPTGARGTLAVLWQDSSAHASCLLIWIAQVLWRVSRALTSKSVGPFERKVQDLLKLDGRQFEELLTELEIAAGLSERVSPIAFEPLVPYGASEDRKPYSPDYAVRLPDGDLLIETTVLRIAAFDRWEAEGSRLSDYIGRRLEAESISRVLNLELPIDFRFDTTPRWSLVAVIRDIVSTAEGERQVSSTPTSGSVRWAVPPIAKLGTGESAALGAYEFAIAEGELKSALYISRKPHFQHADAAQDLIVRSLRNTLDYKLKKWSKLQAPYVLALRFGHSWLNSGGMTQAIAERIMPNAKYRRLSGVLRYTPPDFATEGRAHDLFLLTNDAAEYPVGAKMWDLFKGKAQFHLA